MRSNASRPACSTRSRRWRAPSRSASEVTISQPDDLRLPERPSIVAIDLDGTALDSTGLLRERTRRAIEDLLTLEVPTAIATARPARGVHRLLGTSLFEALDLVHVDGAIIDHRTRDQRHHHPLPDGAARAIVDIASKTLPEARIVVEIEGWEFGSDQPATTEELWAYNSATPEMVMPVAAALERQPVKVAINAIDRPVARAAKAIDEALGSSIRLLHHQAGTFLSVVAPEIGKRSGVTRLLGDRPEAWSNAIAFGDDYSDIELLEAVGYGFAMANAAPEVQAIAAQHAPGNDEDGLAQVLEALIARLR